MRIPRWLRWRSHDDLDEEIRTHLQYEIENNLSRGMTPEDARSAALRTFGNATRVQERVREGDPLAVAGSVVQDLQHSLRLWSKNPGFAIAAVVAIGLGIGVNAAIFTVANAVLLKPLAYEANGHFVYVQGAEAGCELPCDTARSYPDFLDFRAEAKSFDALVAYAFAAVNLSDTREAPERYRAMKVTANAFSTFGQQPKLGRDFTTADERVGAAPVALLTYTLWETRYGRDASIIGKAIRVDDVPTVVIGVLGPKMQFRVPLDLWLPLVPSGQWQKRDHRGLMMLGRLAQGATLQSARSEMTTISRRLEKEYSAADKGLGISVLEGRDYFNRRIRTVLVGLWIAVGLVLLVACANVANLLLGRAVARAREISIRVALGAGRWRIVRQLLVESITLSTAGGFLGWLLAIWGVRAFDIAVAGTGKPAWVDFSMDYTVFAYLSAISIGAGIAFGLVPALRLSKVDVHATLKDGGHAASGGSRGRFLSGLLVAGQMATAVTLLVGTVLVVRTLLTLYSSEIGVKTAGVLTMSVSLPDTTYSRPDDRLNFYDQLQTRIRALPGVEAVSLASSLPGHEGMSFAYEVEGSPAKDSGANRDVRGLIVAPGYFHTMGAETLAGREFTGADSLAGMPAVIVNRSFAAQYWPGLEAVGRRLRLIEGGAQQPWLTVVGVAPDIWQNETIRREFQPLIYLPYGQRPLGGMSVMARTRVPPATLAQALRLEVKQLDEHLTVYALRTLDADIELHDWAIRVFGSMFAIFAVIATVLASVGLYAVVAGAVNQRLHEIGVRIALGATSRDIVVSVLAQGMRQVAIGLVVGLLAAFGLIRALRSLLAGTFRPDAATFLIVALLLIMAGLVACAIPARRATHVDPLVALRLD